MNGFNWEYNFDPDFPMHIFPFTVIGNRDSMHWHQYFEIGLCIGGSGKFVYTNNVYNVKKGDIFMTNNFENHVAISEKNSSTKYLFLIFLPSFIADPHGRKIDLKYLSPFKYNPLNFQNKIDADHPVAQHLYSLFMDTYHLYINDNSDSTKLEIDIKVRQILLELVRYHSKDSKQPNNESDLINVKIQNAIKYINIHYAENITIAKMAGILKMNPSYFRHLFKKHMNISFKPYITYLRLAQARKLLLATDKNINDIIFEVGYINASHFYTIFEKYSHMSPGEYRKQYRNDKQ